MKYGYDFINHCKATATENCRETQPQNSKALALGCHLGNLTILGVLPVVVSLALLIVFLGVHSRG